MRRRTFLRSSIAAGTSFAISGSMLRSFAFPDGRLGHIAADDRSGERILVILRMFGGNDGLNTIVPIHSDEYYRIRKAESQHDLSIAPERVLPIPGVSGFGLHPSMAPLLELYQEGKVAIVQGVGYPDMDLSHFRGTDIWLSASDANVYETSGWIGRWLDKKDNDRSLASAPYAIEFGSVPSRVLYGRHDLHGYAYTEALSSIDRSGLSLSTFDHDQAAVLAARCLNATQHSAIVSDALLRVREHSRSYPEPAPLSNALRYTSRLIRAGMPTQVYVVHAGQFDTHHHQQAVHAQQLDELFRNVHAFIRELEDSGDAHRVCVLPISEFGRRVEPTESGTDHGTAAPVFVIGHGVKGGMYGMPPSVEDLDRDNNLLWNVDFRQIYSSIMRQWFGQEPSAVDGSVLARHFSPLDLFHTSDKSNSEMFNIAPIPVNDHLNIIGKELRSVMATATIVDLQGREIQRTRVDLSTVSVLDAARYNSGVYLLTIRTDDGREYTAAFPLERR